jgi:hypothetical protein
LKIGRTQSGRVKHGRTVKHNHPLQSVAQGGHCDQKLKYTPSREMGMNSTEN